MNHPMLPWIMSAVTVLFMLAMMGLAWITIQKFQGTFICPQECPAISPTTAFGYESQALDYWDEVL